MDFVKKAADTIKGGSSGSSGSSAPAGDAAQGGKQDYVDKAFSMGAKKTGHEVDPGTQEKITDSGRAAYEKLTGSKVNPKISN